MIVVPKPGGRSRGGGGPPASSQWSVTLSPAAFQSTLTLPVELDKAPWSKALEIS